MKNELKHNLQILIDAINLDFSRACNSLGLSRRQVEYLELIESTENCTSKNLARILNIRKPTVTTGVAFLINEGLIKKAQSETDKRVYPLVLTAKGKKRIEKIHRVKEEIIQKYLAELNSKDLKHLSWIINKIVLLGNLK